MHDMMKRLEIQILRRAGHPQDEVATLTGVPVRTVRRIEAETAVTSIDTEAERRERGVGRPREIDAWRPFIERVLATEPSLMTLELLRRARMDGYAGGKSGFYDLVASLRPRPVSPLVRFEGLAGEFSQHDFGQVDVRFVDGAQRRVHFFASRLKFSRWVQVTLVPDQRVESVVRPLVEHFEAFGGMPLLAVFDRPKTIAIAWQKDGTVTEWNATFSDVIVQLGVGVELCWPYQARQKGSVENLVGWVKGSFFKQRRFLDDEDLARQLADWHVEVNCRTPSRATGVTPLARMEEERRRLRPLRVTPATLALRFPVQAGPTGVVLFDGNEYSMPPDAIGLAGTLFLHRDRVRIIAGRFESVHPRLFGSKQKSLLPEHRSAMVAQVSGKRGKRYLKRQHLLELGEAALAYLTEIVHRRPRSWCDDVDRLHDLLGEHGEVALRDAIAAALAHETFGWEYVATHLRSQVAPASVAQQGMLL
jgi:transposase